MRDRYRRVLDEVRRWLGARAGWLFVWGVAAVVLVALPWLRGRYPEAVLPAPQDVGTVALIVVTYLYVRYTQRLVELTRDVRRARAVEQVRRAVAREHGPNHVMAALFARADKSYPLTVDWLFGDPKNAAGSLRKLDHLGRSLAVYVPEMPAELRVPAEQYRRAIGRVASAGHLYYVCYLQEHEDAKSAGRTADLANLSAIWASADLQRMQRARGYEIEYADVATGAIFKKANRKRGVLAKAIREWQSRA